MFDINIFQHFFSIRIFFSCNFPKNWLYFINTTGDQLKDNWDLQQIKSLDEATIASFEYCNFG